MNYEKISEDLTKIYNFIREENPEAAGLHALDTMARLADAHFANQRTIIEQNNIIIAQNNAIAQSLSLLAGTVDVDESGMSSIRAIA